MAKRRSDPAAYIDELKEKRQKLKTKIVIVKREMRTASRILRARQSRILGEALFRLAESGRLNAAVHQQILADVAAHASKNDRGALTDTRFEIGPEPDPKPEQAFGLLRRRLPPTDEE